MDTAFYFLLIILLIISQSTWGGGAGVNPVRSVRLTDSNSKDINRHHKNCTTSIQLLTQLAAVNITLQSSTEVFSTSKVGEGVGFKQGERRKTRELRKQQKQSDSNLETKDSQWQRSKINKVQRKPKSPNKSNKNRKKRSFTGFQDKEGSEKVSSDGLQWKITPKLTSHPRQNSKGHCKSINETLCDQAFRTLAHNVTEFNSPGEHLESVLDNNSTLQCCVKEIQRFNPDEENSTEVLATAIASVLMKEQSKTVHRGKRDITRVKDTAVLEGKHFFITDLPFNNDGVPVRSKWKKKSYREDIQYLVCADVRDKYAEYNDENVESYEVFAQKHRVDKQWVVKNQTLFSEFKQLLIDSGTTVVHIGGAMQSPGYHIQGGQKISNDLSRELQGQMQLKNLTVMSVVWNSYENDNIFSSYGYYESCKNAENAAHLGLALLELIHQKKSDGNQLVGVGHSMGGKIWGYITNMVNQTQYNKTAITRLKALLLSAADENAKAYEISGADYTFYKSGEKFEKHHHINHLAISDSLFVHYSDQDWVLWYNGRTGRLGYGCVQNRSDTPDSLECLDGLKLLNQATCKNNNTFDAGNSKGHSDVYEKCEIRQWVVEQFKAHAAKQNIELHEELVSGTQLNSDSKGGFVLITARKALKPGNNDSSVSNFCSASTATGPLSSSVGRTPESLKVYKGEDTFIPSGHTFFGTPVTKINFEEVNGWNLSNNTVLAHFISSDDVSLGKNVAPAYAIYQSGYFPDADYGVHLVQTLSDTDKQQPEMNSMMAKSTVEQTRSTIKRILDVSLLSNKPNMLVIGPGAKDSVINALKKGLFKEHKEGIEFYGLSGILIYGVHLEKAERIELKEAAQPFLARHGGIVITNKLDRQHLEKMNIHFQNCMDYIWQDTYSTKDRETIDSIVRCNSHERWVNFKLARQEHTSSKRFQSIQNALLDAEAKCYEFRFQQIFKQTEEFDKKLTNQLVHVEKRSEEIDEYKKRQKNKIDAIVANQPTGCERRMYRSLKNKENEAKSALVSRASRAREQQRQAAGSCQTTWREVGDKEEAPEYFEVKSRNSKHKHRHDHTARGRGI